MIAIPGYDMQQSAQTAKEIAHQLKAESKSATSLPKSVQTFGMFVADGKHQACSNQQLDGLCEAVLTYCCS